MRACEIDLQIATADSYCRLDRNVAAAGVIVIENAAAVIYAVRPFARSPRAACFRCNSRMYSTLRSTASEPYLATTSRQTALADDAATDHRVEVAGDVIFGAGIAEDQIPDVVDLLAARRATAPAARGSLPARSRAPIVL